MCLFMNVTLGVQNNRHTGILQCVGLSSLDLRKFRDQTTMQPRIFVSYTCARSLRNLLVSGNECGRVFPAGVGPGSPSRDAANWLPSRFSLSVETRRRYGWLRMMVFPGARLFPSPNLVTFGRVAARERQGALSRRAW